MIALFLRTHLEEEEFLGELADTGQNDSLFKRDSVFVQLHFKLNSGKMQVLTTNVAGSMIFDFLI